MDTWFQATQAGSLQPKGNELIEYIVWKLYMGLRIPVNDCTFPFHFSVLSPFLWLFVSLQPNLSAVKRSAGSLTVAVQRLWIRCRPGTTGLLNVCFIMNVSDNSERCFTDNPLWIPFNRHFYTYLYLYQYIYTIPDLIHTNKSDNNILYCLQLTCLESS